MIAILVKNDFAIYTASLGRIKDLQTCRFFMLKIRKRGKKYVKVFYE